MGAVADVVHRIVAAVGEVRAEDDLAGQVALVVVDAGINDGDGGAVAPVGVVCLDEVDARQAQVAGVTRGRLATLGGGFPRREVRRDDGRDGNVSRERLDQAAEDPLELLRHGRVGLGRPGDVGEHVVQEVPDGGEIYVIRKGG